MRIEQDEGPVPALVGSKRARLGSFCVLSSETIRTVLFNTGENGNMVVSVHSQNGNTVASVHR